MLLTVLCFACNEAVSQGESKVISVKEFSKRIAIDADAVLIDLRTDEELSEGIIEGAQQYDFFDEGFKESIAVLNKNKNYYVYCKSGGRSVKAAEMMKEMGYKVFDLKGGITAWKGKNKNTVKKEVTF